VGSGSTFKTIAWSFKNSLLVRSTVVMTISPSPEDFAVFAERCQAEILLGF